MSLGITFFFMAIWCFAFLTQSYYDRAFCFFSATHSSLFLWHHSFYLTQMNHYSKWFRDSLWGVYSNSIVAHKGRETFISALEILVRWNEGKAVGFLFFINMVGNWSSALDDPSPPVRPTKRSNTVSIQCPTIVQAATFLWAADVVESTELRLEVNVGVIYTHLGTLRRIQYDVECTKLIRQIVWINAHRISFDESKWVPDFVERIFAQYSWPFIGNAHVRHYFSHNALIRRTCC